MSALMGGSKYTRSDCVNGSQSMYKIIGQESRVLGVICCNESLSQHYCHFISPDHPSCALIVFKYGRGDNNNG